MAREKTPTPGPDDTQDPPNPRFQWVDGDVIPLDLDERLPPVEKDVDA